jgi:AraC-like DNA-binding protein
MLSLRHTPPPALAPYIDCFWYSRGRQPQQRRQRALPSGRVDLVFNLQCDRIRTFRDANDTTGTCLGGAIIHGAQSRYFVLDACADVHVLGVHFRAGGGAALLGLPASELTDRHVALEDVWGAHASRMREQLMAANEPASMFAILEREFLRRMSLPLLVHPAISFALRRLDTDLAATKVSALPKATGYSERRFGTLFNQAVGLSPKLYARVRRLGRVVEQIAAGEQQLIDVALANGYYDQSHLNREFREFAGVTPGSYRPMQDRSALHMEVD